MVLLAATLQPFFEVSTIRFIFGRWLVVCSTNPLAKEKDRHDAEEKALLESRKKGEEEVRAAEQEIL